MWPKVSSRMRAESRSGQRTAGGGGGGTWVRPGLEIDAVKRARPGRAEQSSGQAELIQGNSWSSEFSNTQVPPKGEFLDPEDGSQKATQVVLLVRIS